VGASATAGVTSMMAGKALAELGVLVVAAAQAGDAGDGEVFDEDVRCLEDQAAHGMGGAGVEEGDRGAIAVAKEDGGVHAERGEHAGEHVERLVMHEIDGARARVGGGGAMAQAAIDERSEARVVGHVLGKFLPGAD
jgi:hypothetical protein